MAVRAAYAPLVEAKVPAKLKELAAPLLKEVNAAAMSVCEEPEQVVQILDYTLTGRLPKPKDGDAFVPIVDRLGKGNPNP